MQVIENSNVKEKLFIEKLENGLTILVIPKKGISRKYAIIGTKFGSIDNKFIKPGEENIINIPDGVAHFLEHKMFEQPDGSNSLDTLSALGINANAYTTNDHTAYLIDCVQNFDEAFEELLDYVQSPFYTDENVEKEKGIIGQEIRMYDDDPDSVLYLNLLKCLYKNNPIRIDVAGTIESISKIDKNVLYDCYNTFYTPSNMVLALCGDFDVEEIINKVKGLMKDSSNKGEIRRIYPEEPEEILENIKEVQMEVSIPTFAIGIKDNTKNEEKIKKHLAIQIILDILLGKSSELYKELYENGDIIGDLYSDYEFSEEYSYIIISGSSKNIEKVYDKIKKEINNLKNSGIDREKFERIKKKIYGSYVTEYNDVELIGRMFMSDYLKGLNSFDYLENYEKIDLEYTKNVLNNTFREDLMAISIINSK